MDQIIVVVLSWFASYMHVDIKPLPKFVVAPPEYLQEMYGAPVLGLYDRQLQILYISTEVDMTTPFGMSVLVHELWHHYQNIAGHEAECNAKLERSAYRVQVMFLEFLGEERPPLLSEFNIMMRSSCSWEFQ